MVYSETIFPVRYYETDQMGIVHHSNYIRYFECARNNMMAEFGYPIEKCEEDGVTIPIVSVVCRYKHPARMGDVLKVVAMIDKVLVYSKDHIKIVFRFEDEIRKIYEQMNLEHDADRLS